jgi:DNA-binding SARP family transcriptional activator
MYLATRPDFTATRDQVIDELWPDAEPGAAANSLNQSLYFLRREIDPWYEDDLSIEYVPYEGDLVWLDPDLVRVASSAFLAAIRTAPSSPDAETALSILASYGGRFAPEFEYEEWAIAWRTRVEVSFLEFSQGVISRLIAVGRLDDARDVAIRAFEADPNARDVERKLIALYWRLGSRAAAKAQYAHYRLVEEADGLEVPELEDLSAEEISAP